VGRAEIARYEDDPVMGVPETYRGMFSGPS